MALQGLVIDVHTRCCKMSIKQIPQPQPYLVTAFKANINGERDFKKPIMERDIKTFSTLQKNPVDLFQL